MNTFTPHVETYGEWEPEEYHGLGALHEGLLAEFLSLARLVYPQELLTTLSQDGYNPVMVGFDHDGPSGVGAIVERFRKLRGLFPKQPPVVAYELIPPEQIEYVREFLRDEKEFLAEGTVKGNKPSEEKIADLTSYRQKLAGQHGQLLALRLLEEGFDLIPLEHEHVLRWIVADMFDPSMIAEVRKRGFGEWQDLCPGFTAIT